MTAETLPDFGALKEAFALLPEQCRCVCTFAPPEQQIEPALLAAFGVLLIAVGVFGYATGRIRRIRARLRDGVLT